VLHHVLAQHLGVPTQRVELQPKARHKLHRRCTQQNLVSCCSRRLGCRTAPTSRYTTCEAMRTRCPYSLSLSPMPMNGCTSPRVPTTLHHEARDRCQHHGLVIHHVPGPGKQRSVHPPRLRCSEVSAALDGTQP
jgi:hypothetical protein